jgi:hypothetical protein
MSSRVDAVVKGKKCELRNLSSNQESHDLFVDERASHALGFSFLNDGQTAMNIIFFFIIMVIICNGCNKTFRQSHGLSRHRTTCLAAKEHTASLAQKRLNLQKVGNGSGNVLGPSNDVGSNAQQQEVMEDVSSS